MIRRFRYFIGKALESMRRAPWLTTATIAMLMVLFLLFNGYALIFLNVEQLADRWIGSVRMTVFLQADVTPQQAQDLALSLRQRPEIGNAFFVTASDAKERFLADFPGGADVLQGLPENPLPASLELELAKETQTTEQLDRLAAEIAKLPGVEDALFGRELFSKLSALIGLLRVIGALLGLALMVAVLFLSANTIRLNLYARREELDILQVVGATRWFIRWPFLIEGLLSGLSSALLSLALAYGLFHLSLTPLSQALAGPFGAVHFSFLSIWQIVLFLCAAALLGATGSFVALGRFWRAI